MSNVAKGDTPNPAADGDQSTPERRFPVTGASSGGRPGGHGDAGQSGPGHRRTVVGAASSDRQPDTDRGARPVREFHMSRSDRLGNAIFNLLVRAGIGPAHLLTTRGRKTGRPHTNPVILVRQDDQRWLVAPYGAVAWVLNARAAGRVTLRRGRDRHDYTITELPPEEAGPVLKRYVAVASATRPYFRAGKDAPVADFVAEAHRHPVFALTPTVGSRGLGGDPA